MSREKTELIREMQDELFQVKGEGWFEVKSGSMSPFIRKNDLVFVKVLAISDIRPGDIILFKMDNIFIIHRVIRIFARNGEIKILQKGDASPYASAIHAESIAGRVVGIKRNGIIMMFDSRRIRIINFLLIIKNCVFYGLEYRIYRLKQWSRDKPGYALLSSLYRILKTPCKLLKRLMEKMIMPLV